MTPSAKPPKPRTRAKAKGTGKRKGNELAKPRGALDGLYETKLTPEVQAKMVSALRSGGTLETSATYAGIHRSTFHRWLKEGRLAIERNDRTAAAQPAADFVRAIDDALAQYKLSLTTGILAASEGENGQWQALAWLAERRWPDEFGRRQRVEHANADGQPFQTQTAPLFDPSKLDNDELDTLIRLARKAAPDGIPAPPRQLPDIEHRQV